MQGILSDIWLHEFTKLNDVWIINSMQSLPQIITSAYHFRFAKRPFAKKPAVSLYWKLTTKMFVIRIEMKCPFPNNGSWPETNLLGLFYVRLEQVKGIRAPKV